MTCPWYKSARQFDTTQRRVIDIDRGLTSAFALKFTQPSRYFPRKRQNSRKRIKMVDESLAHFTDSHDRRLRLIRHSDLLQCSTRRSLITTMLSRILNDENRPYRPNRSHHTHRMSS